jgi:hypothetical protein
LRNKKGLQCSHKRKDFCNYNSFATAFTIAIFLLVIVKSCRFVDYRAKVMWSYTSSFLTLQE